MSVREPAQHFVEATHGQPKDVEAIFCRRRHQHPSYRVPPSISSECIFWTKVRRAGTPSAIDPTNTGEPAAAGGPRQLPYTPEDQNQEQDRQPLTYDYNCKGTVIVIHAQFGACWEWKRPRPFDGPGKLAERV
jgi:hypothetical protein